MCGHLLHKLQTRVMHLMVIYLKQERKKYKTVLKLEVNNCLIQ